MYCVHGVYIGGTYYSGREFESYGNAFIGL